MTCSDPTRSIPDGSIVHLRLVNLKNPFEIKYGKAHAILFKNGNRLLKVIDFGDYTDPWGAGNRIHCKSLSPDPMYKPFWLNVSSIAALFVVEQIFPRGKMDQDLEYSIDAN